MKPETFIFDRYSFDANTGVLRLNYAFDNGEEFEEVITFTPPFIQYNTEALDRLFKLIFLLAGISYYKAYVPANLICNAFALDDKTARWMEHVYLHGLGEFAHQNNLDLRGKINFKDTTTEQQKPITLDLQNGLLVPIGGGKDSVVTLETLKQANHNITCFALGGAAGPATPIMECIKTSGTPHIFVSRTIDPALITLNKIAGVYNGHIPITAILSATALASAVLYGFKAVVMSNEHSASAPNFVSDGFAVNHQYSKSFEFERDLAHYIARNISPDLQYFSFLRPCSEINIMRRFAKLTQYHDIFRSCNTAFKQNRAERNKNWCGHCPKCHFVFLGLAPFMDRQKLIDIFGFNLLDDDTQTKDFEKLCGIDATKPFECVGETEESAACVKHLSTLTAWKNDIIIQTLAPKITDVNFEKLFELHTDHAVPSDYLKALHA